MRRGKAMKESTGKEEEER